MYDVTAAVRAGRHRRQLCFLAKVVLISVRFTALELYIPPQRVCMIPYARTVAIIP